MTTRRTFLKTSSLATAAAVSRQVLGAPPAGRAPLWHSPPGAHLPVTDPQIKELAMRALDAAKVAGASYADVRFTTTRRRTFQGGTPTDSETRSVGVRALAAGAWGFAAHSDWPTDLVPQLGRQAAEIAKVMAWPRVPPIQLVDSLPAATGTWSTPVTRDPFTVPPEEITALIQSLTKAVQRQNGGLFIVLSFERQERIFASTTGAYTTQTIYTSLGGVPHQNIPPSHIVVAAQDPQTRQAGAYAVPFVTPTGAGYELLEEAKVLDHVDEWIAKAGESATAKPFFTLGEYDVVFDGAAMAALVDGTLGVALEYDRAVGYEANAGGTSYLAPPLKLLGTAIAPKGVTLTGDRTLARGCATVGWDDEGVTPQPFPLVQDGVLVDYATSREFVAELAPYYQRHHLAVRSRGCTAAESAFTVPLVYAPNLVLQPAAQDSSVEALVAGVDDGFLICGGEVQMDIQQSSGRGRAEQVYAIKHGKVAGLFKGAAYSFRSRDLWKNLVALGGASTAVQRGCVTSKGQPNQGAVHSVRAVAARFGKVQLDNASRE